MSSSADNSTTGSALKEPGRVAVVGAGRMGRPIVDRLVAAGFQPVVTARRPETQAAADAAGWRWADSVAATVADAAVVLTLVFNDDQLRSVALGDQGALATMAPGSVLVQHTTCDPRTVESLGVAAAQRGVGILDAALSGTPRDIEAGRLTLWVGGAEATLAAARPVLAAYGSPIMPVGPIGNGQRIKLINNALFVAQVGLAVDAVRLGGSLGFAEDQLVTALLAGSGASRALGSVAWIGAESVGARLAEFMIKDVDAVRSAAATAQADLGLIGAVLDSQVVRTRVLGDGVVPDRSSAPPPRLAPGSVKDDSRFS